MDFFLSLGFFIRLSIFLGIMFVINFFEINKKREAILAVSLVFITLTIGPVPGLLVLLLYLLYEYVLINIAFHLRRKHGMYYPFYFIICILSMLPLILLKAKPLFNNGALFIIGLSYMTFKNLQILIENNEGSLVEVLPIDYMSLMMFFPSFLAGPLDTVKRYVPESKLLYGREVYLEMCGTGLYRLITGIFFKFVLSDFFYIKLINLQTQNLVIYAFYYLLYLYFDISGYSSLAIGSARIIGIKLPENFSKPLLSLSFIEFWDKWLMSVVSWFKKFVYSRLKEILSELKVIKDDDDITVIAVILSFMIFGIWHGFRIKYLMFGLFNGIIYSINYYYRVNFPLHDRFKDNVFYKLLSWILTMITIMFSFLIFSGRLM